jgi:hypothetical protein
MTTLEDEIEAINAIEAAVPEKKRLVSDEDRDKAARQAYPVPWDAINRPFCSFDFFGNIFRYPKLFAFAHEVAADMKDPTIVIRGGRLCDDDQEDDEWEAAAGQGVIAMRWFFFMVARPRKELVNGHSFAPRGYSPLELQRCAKILLARGWHVSRVSDFFYACSGVQCDIKRDSAGRRYLHAEPGLCNDGTTEEGRLYLRK